MLGPCLPSSSSSSVFDISAGREKPELVFAIVMLFVIENAERFWYNPTGYIKDPSVMSFGRLLQWQFWFGKKIYVVPS